MRIRRPCRLFLRFRDRSVVSLATLLRGEIQAESAVDLVALSPATGKSCALEAAELSLLQGLERGRWTPVEEIGIRPERLEVLIDCGVLIADEAHAIDRRDRGFDDQAWGEQAALFFGLSSYRQETDGEPDTPAVALERSIAESAEAYRGLIERNGPPPPAFHAVGRRLDRLSLPEVDDLEAPLGRVLERRRTVRLFDPERPLALSDLARVLGVTFGCRGTTRMAPELTLVQRTSPSGGSLHPIEAYPLLLDVEGAAPGLYHYNAEAHALDLLRLHDREEAASLAVRFLGGQDYAAGARMIVLLTARFARAFWKYRHNDRAFLVVAMDAGHLGQTFYLACTALGIGPFFSAAIDAAAITEALALEPAVEGPLAACGCGWPAAGADGGLDREPCARPAL